MSAPVLTRYTRELSASPAVLDLGVETIDRLKQAEFSGGRSLSVDDCTGSPVGCAPTGAFLCPTTR